MPGLDGLRALALIAVLLFHSEFTWARGGYLGVTTFFVLSGFLITGLLLRERETTGGVRLRAFWSRRARRLLPAVLVLIGLVAVLAAAGAGFRSRTIFGDGLASSFWLANWRFVFAHRSYAALFSSPSPFEHMWSLAVEEQVYLLLPLVLLVGLGRHGDRSRRGRLAVIVGAGIVASTLAAAWLHRHGGASLHEYYGTDARAAEPLVGALLAVALVGRAGLRSAGRIGRAALDVAGFAGAAVLILLVATLGQERDALYRGGFLVAALASAAVVAAATQPGVMARLLGVPPLAAIGRISYGAYLFHWPIFLWLTPHRTGLAPLPLLAARATLTVVLAAASSALVELPVRRGGLSWPVAPPTWATSTVALLGALALATAPSVAASSSLFTAAGPLAPPPPPPPPVVSAAPLAAASTASTAAGADAASTPATATPRAATVATSAPRASGPTTTAAPPAARLPDSFTAPAATPATPPPTTAPNPATKQERIAIVGDSMAAALARGMEAWAKTRSDVVIYDLSTPGCPLSRGGGNRRLPDGSVWAVDSVCSWWNDPGNARSVDLAQFHPDVVIMHDGFNEVPDRKLPQWPDYRHPGQPLFDQWLFSEYQAAVKTFSNSGGKVLALNTPCADWQRIGGSFSGYLDNGDGDRRIASLNAEFSGLATDGAKVADLDSQLCPNGKFTETVDGVSNARPDGYHLSDAASTALAGQWLGPLALQTKPASTSPIS